MDTRTNEKIEADIKKLPGGATFPTKGMRKEALLALEATLKAAPITATAEPRASRRSAPSTPPRPQVVEAEIVEETVHTKRVTQPRTQKPAPNWGIAKTVNHPIETIKRFRKRNTG